MKHNYSTVDELGEIQQQADEGAQKVIDMLKEKEAVENGKAANDRKPTPSKSPSTEPDPEAGDSGTEGAEALDQTNAAASSDATKDESKAGAATDAEKASAQKKQKQTRTRKKNQSNTDDTPSAIQALNDLTEGDEPLRYVPISTEIEAALSERLQRLCFERKLRRQKLCTRKEIINLALASLFRAMDQNPNSTA